MSSVPPTLKGAELGKVSLQVDCQSEHTELSGVLFVFKSIRFAILQRKALLQMFKQVEQCDGKIVVNFVLGTILFAVGSLTPIPFEKRLRSRRGCCPLKYDGRVLNLGSNRKQQKMIGRVLVYRSSMFFQQAD